MVIPKWLSSYLNEKDLDRLEQQVKKIELGTEAEIVPVIVRSSSHYPQTAITLILVGVLIFTMVWEAVGINMHWDAFWPALTGAVASLALIFVVLPRLALIPVIQRLFTVRGEEQEQCWKRARIEFYENRVNQTGDGVGVLIFVSMLEKSVIVLADKKISDALPKETWQNVVDEILGGIKNGKMAAGLEKGLSACSDLLIKHFPVKLDDRDELPNKVIIKE
jgi:putative membrane protein